MVTIKISKRYAGYVFDWLGSSAVVPARGLTPSRYPNITAAFKLARSFDLLPNHDFKENVIEIHEHQIKIKSWLSVTRTINISDISNTDMLDNIKQLQELLWK